MPTKVLKAVPYPGALWLIPAVTAPVPVPVPTPIPTPTPSPSPALALTGAWDRFRVFNRDDYSGGAFGKGHGAVQIGVPSSAAGASLWVRLHDALDATAQSATPGSGAILVPSAQVTQSLKDKQDLLIPAALAWYYADLAPRQDMSGAMRIPIPFGVGAVVGLGPGTSHGSGFVTAWAYAQGVAVPQISKMVDISPFGTVWAQTSSYAGISGGKIIPGEWQKPGDPGVSPYETTFAAEFLRRLINRAGVVCAMVGRMEQGGNNYGWLAPYDLRADHAYGGIVAALQHADFKTEVQLALSGANDAGSAMTEANSFWLLNNVFDDLAARNPNKSSGVVTAASPLFDTGDASDSWDKLHRAQRHLQKQRRTVNLESFDAGGLWSVANHTTMLSRKRIAVSYYRAAAGLMGPTKGGLELHLGPRITGGRWVGDEIELDVQHDGGKALQLKAWSEAGGLVQTDIDTTGKPGADMAYLFNVYAAGKVYGDTQKDPALKWDVASVRLSGPGKITLTLAKPPAIKPAVDVRHGMDFGTPTSAKANPPYVTAIFDDLDEDNIGWGRQLCRTIDPVYVPAATPAAQSITLDQPLDPVAGGWCYLSFTGTGATLNDQGAEWFASSIEVSVNGGAYTVPDGLRINNDNRGSALVPMPNTPGARATIAARRIGQSAPDGTVTVTVTSARDEVPASDGLVAVWDVMNRGTLWQDTAKTIPATHLSPVRVLADALGDASNDLVITKPEPVGCPFLDLRKRPWGTTNIVAERPYLMVGANVGADGKYAVMRANDSNAVKSLTGDTTVFWVVDSYGSNWFSLGSAQSFLEIDGLNKISQPSVQCGKNSVKGAAIGGPLMDYLAVRYNATTGTLTLDNVKGTTTNTAGTPGGLVSPKLAWLGGVFAGYYGNVRVHQCLLWNRYLPDDQLAAVKARYAAKWPVA